MYFKSFNFDDNNFTNNQKSFIKALSEMLEQFMFPQLAKDELVATKNDTDLVVSLPHKILKDIDCSVAMNDKEIIVFFADAHHHFDSFSDGDEWIKEAVNFISLMLQGKFEVHTFYRRDKIIKEKIYHVMDNGEKKLISSCFNILFFIPFLKTKHVIKKISYY